MFNDYVKFAFDVPYDNSLKFTVSTPAADTIAPYQGSLFDNHFWTNVKKVARAIYERISSLLVGTFRTFRKLWDWIKAHPYLTVAILVTLFGVIYVTRIRKNEDVWAYSEKYALPCQDKRLERGFCGEVTLVDE